MTEKDREEYRKMVQARKSEPVQVRVVSSPGESKEETDKRNAELMKKEQAWLNQTSEKSNELRSSFSKSGK